MGIYYDMMSFDSWTKPKEKNRGGSQASEALLCPIEKRISPQ
jgi:hypothetical protein